MSFDIYEGWIVSFVDGQWRHCRVTSGYIAIAPHDRPNQHLGIIPLSSFCRHEGKVCGTEVACSQYVFVGSQVINPDVLDRISVVRFGRTASTLRAIRGNTLESDLDDLNGVDCDWPRRALPAMPARWTRTSRSLVHS
jgi:hypothetical protein